LYDKQFALYVDNILARIELQEAAYREDEHVPAKLFAIYAEQRAGLETLRAQYGPIVSVEQILEATRVPERQPI
ncbi:MAG: hypothetical protein PVG71_05810, partial [Anaerolineae bacterium]